MPSRQAALPHSCRVCGNWAGPKATTCGSIIAGALAISPSIADTRRNWSRSLPTSSWQGGPVVASLQHETRTVPIVFTQAIDPVALGFVASLARPGGNITGFSNIEYGFSGKCIELLKRIAPGVTRAAVLRDATVISGDSQFAAIQAVAPSGMELSPINVHDAREIEGATTAFARETNGGLIVTASTMATVHRDLI